MTHKKKIILIVLLVVTCLFALWLIFLFTKKSAPDIVEQQQAREQGKLAPTQVSLNTVQPLATGIQTYTIITHKPRNPQITEVSFDPLDAKKGETQTITVKVTDNKNGEIKNENSATVLIKTDHKETSVDLKLIKVESQPALTTIWQGSVMFDDTSDMIYSAVVNTKNIYGTDTAEINIR